MEAEPICDEIWKLMKNDRFVKLCGIKLDEIRPGYARTSLDVQEIHLNGVNVIQGGVLFTMADYAFAAAANSRGKISVSIEASISYFKGVSSGKIIAEATERECKNSLSWYDVTIRNEKGELIALYHGTAFRKQQSGNVDSIE